MAVVLLVPIRWAAQVLGSVAGLTHQVQLEGTPQGQIQMQFVTGL